MGKSKPQPKPDDRETSPPSAASRQPLDVVVAPPQQPLAPILLSGTCHGPWKTFLAGAPAAAIRKTPSDLECILPLGVGRPKRRGRGSMGMRISFDEANLVNSRRESLHVRGIISRVDEAFDDLGLYFASDFSLKSQAADKLKGLHRGAFLVYGVLLCCYTREPAFLSGLLSVRDLSYVLRLLCVAPLVFSPSPNPTQPHPTHPPDSPDAFDEMVVTYVDKRGGAQHAALAHCFEGLYIVFGTEKAAEKAAAGPYFERLSNLMLHYASDEADPPSVFALTEEQREVLSGNFVDNDEDEEEEDEEDEEAQVDERDYLEPTPLAASTSTPATQTAAAPAAEDKAKEAQPDAPAWLKRALQPHLVGATPAPWARSWAPFTST